MITDDIKVALDGITPGPWEVRKLMRDGEMLDCFVQAPDCQGFAYAAQILGDDEYREDAVRKLADHELVAAAPELLTRALAEIESLQAQLRTYGDQRAAEAREQMREECIAIVEDHPDINGTVTRKLMIAIKELP